MAERKESYFYKEIKAALERQGYFATGIRFVIPVQLTDGVMLDELERLQSVDLTAPQGIQELAQAVQEDWNRRGRRRTL